MSGGFTLVNVVSKRVRTDAALEVLSRLLRILTQRPIITKDKERKIQRTILGTVLGLPSASFSPLLVPAPEKPETPKIEGICTLSR